MSANGLKPTDPITGLELLQLADRVQRGTATDQDAARIRRAADLLASDMRVPDASPGIQRIAHERTRHICEEGYSSEGDAGRAEPLSAAAACYALPLLDGRRRETIAWGGAPEGWPFDKKAWKPGKTLFGSKTEDFKPYLTPNDRIRELEKAGSLIAAAIDTLLQENDASGGEGRAA